MEIRNFFMKRAQGRGDSGFARVMTLAVMLLTVATTGAWAQSALTGAFTINADGDQVQFSSGNLQATYNGSAWSWAFAANQWDYIGNAEGNTSINGNGTVSANNVTVDLFGWVGASSTWTGAAQYGISNSTATDNTDGYGNSATEALKSDWGATIGSGWRTLTKDEWTYLFNTRTVNGGTGSGKSYTPNATVGSKMGVVIYPDNYTGSVYSGSDWASFEAAGCVFLPAAGLRKPASVLDAGSYGYYWSSSPCNASNAYYVIFHSGELDPMYNGKRSFGFSVRLVKTYETPPAEPGKYTVTMAAEAGEGWTIAPAEATTTGVDANTTITATYTGTKHVKSVTAVVKAAAPAAASLIVNPVVGQIIGSDGKNYAANATLPTGVTAVAKICYVGSDNGEAAPYNHGLAIALSDANSGSGFSWKTSNNDAGHTKQTSSTFTEESGLQYNDTHNSDTYPAFQAAITYSPAAPTGCSAWFLASGYQWQKMIDAVGGYTNLGLTSGAYYWSSSECNANEAWDINGTGGAWYNSGKNYDDRVRACLAF